MKKYIAFFKTALFSILKNKVEILGSMFSYTVHILVFSVLWDFVLEGKTMCGYTEQELVWYVAMAEVIMYSFYHYYKKIAYKVEMGDFAYDMTKPYNFLSRVIVEGIAEIPLTLILMFLGIILSTILVGAISFSIVGIGLTIVILVLGVIGLLMLNVIVGMLSIWLGRDVSSVWLLAQKAMLIFAFSPLELMPKVIQLPLRFLPTTNILYTPAKVCVHFSPEVFLESFLWEIYSLTIFTVVLTIIYKKGVKKQNVNGI